MDNLRITIPDTDLKKMYGTEDYYDTLHKRCGEIAGLMFDEGHPVFEQVHYKKGEGLRVDLNPAIVPLLLGLDSSRAILPDVMAKEIDETMEEVLKGNPHLRKLMNGGKDKSK